MTNANGGDFSDMSILDLFRIEAENQCDQISEDLIALELDPTSSDLLESLMRASHSIKGAARVVELHPAVKIAHAMEDVFVAAQDGKITLDQDGIDLMLKGVDMINSISQITDDETEFFFQEKEAEIDSLANSFSALAKGEKALVKPVISQTTPESAPSSPDKLSQVPEVEKVDSIQLPVDMSDMSMLDLFRMEAENHCRNLSENLVALENDPTSTELLDTMMRAAHSMKGAARIVELHAAVKIAHAMEDVFVAAQKQKIILDKGNIDTLLHGVDLLTAIANVSESEADKWFAENNSSIDSLVKILESTTENIKVDKQSSPPKHILPKEKPIRAAAPEPSVHEEMEPAKTTAEVAEQPVTSKRPARRAEDKDGLRAVRVSAQNMDRIMGMAGESLIESRWLPTLNKELLHLKYRQDELHITIDKIRENLQETKIDDLTLDLFNDLQHKLEICRSMLEQDMEVLDDHAGHAADISNRLYNEIITSKMRPFSEGTRGFSRMVRDVAKELGKKVNFEIIGPDTMVDRDILDKIEAPLNHMIRNSLDHGLETPEERTVSGKQETGTLQLIARHSAGMLSITVRDDGRGIDLEKLRQAIVDKKMCGPEMAADLTKHELLEFLFLPNFSTKKSVSKVSGRGVGMDVVHSVISEVRGKIRFSTTLNEGSSFELQLPLTLSVLRALLTEINSEAYAFPLVSIDHVVQLTTDQIQEVEGRQYFTFNDKRIGIVSAQQIFKTETPTETAEELIYVIVFSDRLNLYGLTVDKLLGVRDLVVQSLDPRLGKVKDISSAAILEDGTPVLIIDVEDVFRSLDQLISGNRLMRIGQDEKIDKRTKRILVADDSITIR